MVGLVSNYPTQRNSRKHKRTSMSYRKDTANFIISQALSLSDKEAIDRLYEAAKGVIKLDDYKKTLNPYNSTDPKFQKFPATLRNYDIIRPIIRRYVGEFIKQVHNFQVKIVNSDVVMLRNQYVAAEVIKLAMQEFRNAIAQQQAQLAQQEQGGAPQQEAPPMPDFQQIVNEQKAKYIDSRAVQGQDILEAIQDWTDSTIKYYQCFYDFIVTGSCYTYRDVRGDALIKDVISPYNYYPISNGEYFVEDHDQGVAIESMSYEQVLSKLGHMLEPKHIKLIQDFIDRGSISTANSIQVPLSVFTSNNDGKDYTSFTGGPGRMDADGKNVYITKSGRNIDVAHVVYKTEVPVWFVSGDPKAYGLSIADFEDAVFDDTVPNEYRDLGVKLEKDWIFETWEIYRIGDPELGIFTKPQPVICQRRDTINPANVKLPYNGITELLTNAGVFSIPEYVAPYQAMRNIIFYAREKAIAKNKDKVILMPMSLTNKNSEEKVYRMSADGILRYDDSEDTGGQKQAGFRVLDASSYNYIKELTEIARDIRTEAWDSVDMNDQRIGDIGTSAGATTTQEAIARSSMGSVIIFTMFDKFRERDYQADLDFSKVSLSSGEAGQYVNGDGEIKNLEFDIDDHINAMYGMFVRNSQVENDKFNKLEGVALAAAQNGEFDLAIETVQAGSVAKLSAAIRKYQQIKREYEQSETQKDRDSQMAIAEKQNDLIDTKFQHDLTIEGIKQDNENYRKELEVGMAITNQNLEGVSDPDAIKRETNALNQRMKDKEINLKQRQHNDLIRLKKQEMESKERIAAKNKNKYD